MKKCVLIVFALLVNAVNSLTPIFQNYFKYSGNIRNLRECKDKCVTQSQFFFGGNLLEDQKQSNNFVKSGCSCRKTFEVYFPKCCPPDYVYEPEDHKCIQSNVTGIHEESSFFHINLIKPGLEQCKVVDDNIISKSDFLQSVEISPIRMLTFQHREYLFENYCFDKIIGSEELVLKLCQRRDFCSKNNKVRCIKKCCPDGQMYIGNKCTSQPSYGLALKNHSDIINNASEPFAIYVADPFPKHIGYKTKFDFNIEMNGSIFVNENGTIREYIIEDSMYCLEYYNGFDETTFFLLFSPSLNHSKFQFIRPAMIVSCICLGITLLGYSVLKELHNLIGKIIINYCTAFLVAWIALVVTQVNPDMKTFCFASGVLIMFAFLASFTWMNVMCYDIWCTLGSVKLRCGSGKRGDNQKLAWYSLYAWLIPIVITLLAVFDHFYWILPAHLHPHIGELQCFIEDRRKKGNYGYLLYFIIPCGVLIFFNVMLFIRTVHYCLKVKSEINSMKDSPYGEKRKKKDFLKIQKQSISVIIKLFIVMGVPWMHETISSTYPLEGNKFLEILGIILDTFNSLQGFFIFCIFMLKKKIMYAVALKLGITKAIRKTSAGSSATLTTSGRKHTVSYSRQSSVQNNCAKVNTVENKQIFSRLNAVYENMEWE